LIVTIDGPAAAGKSTVARALAERLAFEYLDTGAMYRAATWKAMKEGVDLHDPAAVARVVAEAGIEIVRSGGTVRVLCDGQDVTTEIRTPQVTNNTCRVADLPAARRVLIEQQRRCSQGHNLVAEGRDQGTDVFPDADVKFYLDASLDARAARRLKDLRELGVAATPQQVRKQIAERDRLDRTRPVGSLRLAGDMIVIDSTDMTADEVVDEMALAVEKASRRRADNAQRAPEGRR
jgi:cytidylate kinase